MSPTDREEFMLEDAKMAAAVQSGRIFTRTFEVLQVGGLTTLGGVRCRVVRIADEEDAKQQAIRLGWRYYGPLAGATLYELEALD
jgi:hypothetical protein